jgi:DHA1 family tetracycline resistance protein-like MFS transporter
LPVLYLCVVVDLIGVGIIIPLLPFFAQVYGANAFTVSLLVAIFSATQFLAAPVLGRLSDRLGRRPVFLGCVMLSCIGYFGLALADDLIVIFLARALNGIGAGKFTVANAIVADLTPANQRAKQLGRLASAFGIGMILGPVLGGLLSGDGAAPAYHRPLFAAGALSALAAVLAFFLVKESLPPAARHASATAPAQGRLRAALEDRTALPVIVVMFAFNFVFAQVITINPLWLQVAFGYGARETGWIMGFIGAVLLVVQALALGPMVARLGERTPLLIALTLMAAAMLATPLALLLPLYLLASAAAAICIAVIGPSSSGLLSRTAQAHKQGSIMGAGQAAASLGQVLGPALAGWLFGSVAPAMPYYVGGALLALTAAVAARMLPRL